MNESERQQRKLDIVFSLSVLAIIAMTVGLTGCVLLILTNAGVLPSDSPAVLVVIWIISCLFVGTISSRVIGTNFIAVIQEITQATQEVSKGNYTIELNEENKIEELSHLAKNFNSMTRQLAGTEMLRNDFVANVSHEFKTPLAAIEGYAALLQKPGLTEEKKGFYTAKIIYNTKRLSQLTGNILLLSRLEAQETDIATASFSLDEQLRESILLHEKGWSEKHLELDVELDAVDCTGNSELLEQVWQNLIGNAIKFGREYGVLRVQLRCDGNNAVVTIEDNGIGMSEQTQKRIFEKFYQGDTSHAAEGNGLGLTLVQRIVSLHHGGLQVTSEPNIGSTFTVTLPLT